MKHTDILKVGIIQQTCSADVEANKQKLARNIADVAEHGAQLVVLQELHNSPYFCQVESVDNFDLAEPIPGPSTEFFVPKRPCTKSTRSARRVNACCRR